MSRENVPKLLLATLFLCLSAFYLSAENRISVKDFKELVNNSTALSEPQTDRNGKKMALIIIDNLENIDMGGFRFEVPTGVQKPIVVPRSTGSVVSIWLYVQEGTKRLTISHTDTSISPLRNYNFDNIKIESGKTYRMTLGDLVTTTNGKQYVEFKITPADAKYTITVMVNSVYVPWTSIATEPLQFGTYQYNVTAPDYYDFSGVIVVNDADNRQIEEVTLKPKFGYLTIKKSDDLLNAQIFIDNNKAGTSYLNKYHLSSGKHTITITKKLYEPFQQEITITDGLDLVLEPELVSKATRVSLVSQDPSCQIYKREAGQDEQLSTSGEWNGPIEVGTHTFVVKRKGCKEQVKQLTINKSDNTETYSLPAPTPMYGSIEVSSTPSGAKIFLDYKDTGKKTPAILNNVLATEHELELVMPNYEGAKTTVRVEENQTSQWRATLSNMVNVTISIDPPYARWTINGKQQNGAEQTFRVARGTQLKINASCWSHKSKNVTIVAQQNERRVISLKYTPKLLRKYEMYIEAQYVFSGFIGVGCSMGWNIDKFNLQADFAYALSDNEFSYAIKDTDRMFKDGIDFLVGGRMGFNIDCGNRFRITPQLGASVTFGDGDEYLIDNYFDEGEYSDGMTISLLGSIRFFWTMSEHWGLTFSPEYKYSISGGKFASSELYGKSKMWTDGFSCRVGLCLSF